jgi:anti-anti-sigma factor
MGTRPFAARVRRQNGAVIVDLSGDLIGAVELEFMGAYAEAGADGAASLVLNFSAVDYINSTGIALVVGLLAQARKARQAVVAYGLSDHYERIFQITRLADFMNITRDENGALAAARQHGTSQEEG